ncbi:MAG TPA: sulfite exporter TauE/SafE family protein [Acidimicrobiales bacterium]|nr:sulfite exporter TauE/SafE family protein [Acidimicrobiales bacterium]
MTTLEWVVHLDPSIILAGAIVGFAVGLTGVGGGALMTPVLVLLLHVEPSAAVSSDLVASLFMKPVGGAVHLRRRTVHLGLVRWLALGAVPAAFAGAAVLNVAVHGKALQNDIKLALGIALLLAVAGIVLRSLTSGRAPRPVRDVGPQVPVRRVPTLLVGIFGGFIVGMTSVGSGSLMIVALMFLYPALTGSQLVGTDLVQSVPLVAAAALGQVLFGHVELGLTASLLVGSLPAVYLGARLSARAPSEMLRPAIAVVLLVSALKLVDVGATGLGIAVGSAALFFVGVALVRRRRGHVREPLAAPAPGGEADPMLETA